MLQDAISIIRRLKDSGFEAVMAGGSVRDMIMGIESHDIDIATSALPDQVESLFEHTIPVGKQFGVIIVLINGIQFEVATFRNDGQYSDGRRPDSISFSSMEEDAKRRDLTINGIFYDPIEEKFYDFVEGKKDIENKIIRFIGDSNKRIKEDKLRILRAIRFAVRFDFNIEPDSYVSISRNAHLINQVSSERIFNEILKMMKLGNPRMVMNHLFITGLIDYILPEIKALDGLEQPVEYHPEGDVLRHTIDALELLPKDASETLLIGTLLHDIGKAKTQTFEDRIRFNSHDVVGTKMARQILKRFKVSNEFADQVCALIENHMRFGTIRRMRESKVLRFIRMDKFDEHLLLHYVDCMSSHGGLENYFFAKKKLEYTPPEKIKPKKLLTGKDLIKIGFKPGPIFKEILEKIEDMQLENKIETTEEAIRIVKEKYMKEEVC